MHFVYIERQRRAGQTDQANWRKDDKHSNRKGRLFARVGFIFPGFEIEECSEQTNRKLDREKFEVDYTKQMRSLFTILDIL